MYREKIEMESIDLPLSSSFFTKFTSSFLFDYNQFYTYLRAVAYNFSY